MTNRHVHIPRLGNSARRRARAENWISAGLIAAAVFLLWLTFH